MNNGSCSNDLCRGIQPKEETDGIAMKPENYLTINPGRWEGGVGGTKQIFTRGGSAPRSDPLPFYIPFFTKKVPLSYCWFSVSRHSRQIKIKIKTVQQIKSRIWEMTLAKIQVRGIFRIRDIRRNVLPKFIEICMDPTSRMETNRNMCYRVLLQKREFIIRETHKH